MRTGVVNTLPLPIDAVLVEVAYHLIIAPGSAVADKVVVPIPQRVLPVMPVMFGGRHGVVITRTVDHTLLSATPQIAFTCTEYEELGVRPAMVYEGAVVAIAVVVGAE